MSTALSPPPPRLPSPRSPAAALPVPPAPPTRRASRNRLLPAHYDEPPIPPRLVGSPLLRMTAATDALLSPRAQSQLWIDGDEFGLQRSAPSAGSPASPSARRAHRRAQSIVAVPRASSRSPPPVAHSDPPPPPVPPIPASALAAPGARRSVVQPAPKQSVIPDLDNAPAPALAPPPKQKRASRTVAA